MSYFSILDARCRAVLRSTLVAVLQQKALFQYYARSCATARRVGASPTAERSFAPVSTRDRVYSGHEAHVVQAHAHHTARERRMAGVYRRTPVHVVSPVHVKRCTTGARRVTGQLYAAGRTDTPLRMRPAQPVGTARVCAARERARARGHSCARHAFAHARTCVGTRALHGGERGGRCPAVGGDCGAGALRARRAVRPARHAHFGVGVRASAGRPLLCCNVAWLGCDVFVCRRTVRRTCSQERHAQAAPPPPPCAHRERRRRAAWRCTGRTRDTFARDNVETRRELRVNAPQNVGRGGVERPGLVPRG